jgi:adenine specific DNA methylase Mod
MGVELGEFKEELLEYMEDGDKGPYGIFIAPKCYCFYRVSRDGQEIPIKMRFKGININKDKIVTNVEEILSLDTYALHEFYWGSTKCITIDTFRKLLNNKVYILCSSLEKEITDSKAMRSLNIRQRFLIKEITPSNIDGTIIDL